jgi:hypothetical protein
MYSTISIHWNIKFPTASPGRSRVGPALYVFSLLAPILSYMILYCTCMYKHFTNLVRELLVNIASAVKAGSECSNRDFKTTCRYIGGGGFFHAKPHRYTGKGQELNTLLRINLTKIK